MDADRVNVFDKANRDHLVLGVADNFYLKLFPAKNRFLNQALVGHRQVKAVGDNRSQFLDVVAKAAALAAHRVSGTNDKRETDFFGDFFGAFDRVANARAGRVDAKIFHRLLKDFAVFSALDRVQVDADNLHAVLVKNAGLVQFHRHVQAGLAAKVRKQRVRPFLFDNLRKTLNVKRLDVSGVGHYRVGHNRGRVGVYQYNFIALFAQGLASLSSRIVKLARLTDNNRSRTNNQNFVDVFSFCHFSLLYKKGGTLKKNSALEIQIKIV